MLQPARPMEQARVAVEQRVRDCVQRRFRHAGVTGVCSIPELAMVVITEEQARAKEIDTARSAVLYCGSLTTIVVAVSRLGCSKVATGRDLHACLVVWCCSAFPGSMQVTAGGIVEALGVSTFAESLGVANIPEEATDPATCGVVQGAGMAGWPRRGRDWRCPSACAECTSRCSRGCSAAVVCGLCCFLGGPFAPRPQCR